MAAQKHTQHFNELMHQDNNIHYQPANTYRHMLNGLVIDNGGNNFSITIPNGNEYSFEILPGYKPLGFANFVDKIIVASTNDIISEIGVVTINENGVGSYEPLYHTHLLGFSTEHLIEGFCIRETSTIERFYWTDFNKQPRALNIASEKITKEYLPGELIAGKYYMVVRGNISHAGIDYGFNSANNIFLATSNNYTIASIGDPLKVIEYIDSDTLNFTPTKSTGNIDYKSTTSGSVWCGVKQYTYRLITSEGYQSPWSLLSRPIHVGPSGVSNYQNYQGGGFNQVLNNSTKGIIITVSGIDTRYEEIEVAVIEYDQANNVIRGGVAEIIHRGKVTGEVMDIQHLGQENLGKLTKDELTLSFATILKCKTIATIKNRTVIANFKERPELEGTVTATGVPFVYKTPSDVLGMNNYKFGHKACPSNGIVSGDIYPEGMYVVKSGTVLYNGVNYTVGSTFKGVNGATTFTGGTVKGCIRIKKYNKNNGDPVYKIIELNDDFFDMKGMAASKYLRGHWRKETYRIGLLPIDEFGNTYYARHLFDLEMPSQSDPSGNFKLVDVFGSNQFFTTNHLGIAINNLDLTDIIDKISAFAIVRAPRDKTILCQGLMLPMQRRNIEDIQYGFPIYDATIDAGDNIQNFRFNIVSPELLFDNNSPFYPQRIDGDKIEAVSDLEPTYQSIDSIILNKSYKFYKHAPFVGPLTKTPILEFGECLPGEDTVFISGIVRNKDLGSNISVDDDDMAWGGKTHFFLLEEADWNNGGVLISDKSNPRKLLVNWIRENTNVYGGNSEAAKANTLYQFAGHIQIVDQAFKDDIYDAATEKYMVSGIELFGGDCFVNMFSNSRALWAARPAGGGDNEPYQNSFSFNITFPLESNINVALREGRHYSRDGTVKFIGSYSNGVYYQAGDNDGDIQYEDWKYNFGYSTDDNNFYFPALPFKFNPENSFEARARWTPLKYPGERIDNFRRFAQLNFKDAEISLGQINNLKVGGERLFYWQDSGVGYFSVEEREQISGSTGNPVQIGMGGVMDRHQTITTFAGNQHQFGLVLLPEYFAWFDMKNKCLHTMGFDGSWSEESVVKGMQSFFEEIFGEARRGSLYYIDNPLLGKGVTGCYDIKTKAAYFCFKFKDDVIDKSFTIGLSRTRRKFTGFFDIKPSLFHSFEDLVLGVNPDEQNKMYLNWKGDLCKFFGVVYPFSMDVVINPAIELSTAVDNIEIVSDKNPFDEYRFENSNKQATDNKISRNINYRYIDGKWHSNVPLVKSSRFVDTYLKLTLFKRNYLNDNTISDNIKKTIISLKSHFRIKL
jgi:hypothetical protein